MPRKKASGPGMFGQGNAPQAEVPFINYTPHERQRLFHTTRAKYKLYGGAAGGGKSLALLMECVQQCLDTPGWKVLLLRRTFPELQQSHINRFLQLVPRSLYSFNKQDKIAAFVNGSELRFGYLETDRDLGRYQSDEYGTIAWDELTHFDFSQWSYMTSRNRSVVTRRDGIKPGMIAGTNPGSRGHAWVKALWIDQKPAPGMAEESYDPADYVFIPAKLSDNPSLQEADPEYEKALMRLPVHIRAALLDGSWDVIAGQYFDCFGPHNTYDPAALKPEFWWPRWISVDWGFQQDAAVLWYTQAPDGAIYVYRELVTNGKTPVQLAGMILSLSTGEAISDIYVGHDAWGARTSSQTIAEELDTAMYGVMPPLTRADTDRIGGWLLLYRFFQEKRLWISQDCKRLVETIPLLLHAEPTSQNPAKAEDVMKADHDHAADSLRYGIKSRVSNPPSEPFRLAVERKIDSMDPTSKAIYVRGLSLREMIRPVAVRRHLGRRMVT